ncbi:MAG: hypothetical protein KYX68_12530 [Flavobacterium sp.]|nr:hypothetical protein [Flavobacterium sp.]
MKRLIKIIKYLFLLFLVTTIYAQQEVTNNVSLNEFLAFNSNLNISQEAVTNYNTVIIQQIGNQNKNILNISSNSIDFNVIQNGDFNFIDVTKNATSISELIIQNGNNNYISEYSIYSTNVNSQVFQNGNNNTFLSYGSNSISDNLKINVQANDKTIIVLSK